MPKYKAVFDSHGLKYEIEDGIVTYYRSDEHGRNDTGPSDAPMVMRDISPYQSMADGSMITSRSAHREHLKRHNLIEIGNEKPVAAKMVMPDPVRRKEQIARRLGDMSDRQANQILSHLRSEYGR